MRPRISIWMIGRSIGPSVTLFISNADFLHKNHQDSPSLTLLNLLGVLGVLNVLYVLKNVLNVPAGPRFRISSPSRSEGICTV